MSTWVQLFSEMKAPFNYHDQKNKGTRNIINNHHQQVAFMNKTATMIDMQWKKFIHSPPHFKYK